MPLIYKLGTTQLLKVGTALAGSTACCCVSSTTGRCCHYEPGTPPTASGSLIDTSSWAFPGIVSTCTDGIEPTSCSGVFSLGSTCTEAVGFTCDDPITTGNGSAGTLLPNHCWLWKETIYSLQISTGTGWISGSFCTTCSFNTCANCQITDVTYGYLEQTVFATGDTQPAANTDTTVVTNLGYCGSGNSTVVSNTITKDKTVWTKVGQIACSGAARTTMLASLQTYVRQYSYLEIFAAGVTCGNSPLGKSGITDTLTYDDNPGVTNFGCSEC